MGLHEEKEGAVKWGEQKEKWREKLGQQQKVELDQEKIIRREVWKVGCEGKCLGSQIVAYGPDFEGGEDR